MKGMLNKINEQWVVGTVQYNGYWTNHIPVHPDSLGKRDFGVFVEGREVEFEILDGFHYGTDEYGTYGKIKTKHAKLINMGKILNDKEYPHTHIYKTFNGRYGLASRDEHDQVDGIFDTYQEAVDYGIAHLPKNKEAKDDIESLAIALYPVIIGKRMTLAGTIYEADVNMAARENFMRGYNFAIEKLYTHEEAKEIWNAGQEYWKTSGASTTFEELTEKKIKHERKTN